MSAHPDVICDLDRLGLTYDVMDCDPALADTAQFCEAYGVALALLWVALQLDTLGRRAAGSVRAALAATSPGVRPLDGALPERVEGLQPALAEDEAT